MEVEIEDVAFGGRGLVRLDGLAVFVDQAVPGDRATIRIYKKKKNYAEARLLDLREPSSYRINPPCEYSGFCGGCKWQFLKYEQQLIYKRQHVLDSLEHIGRLHETVVHDTMPSELIFGYRNKMEFSCSDRRWLLPHELNREEISAGFALGLHVPGTFDKVIDIDRCLLQIEPFDTILNLVREYALANNLDAYGLKSHQGYLRFLVLRQSDEGRQIMVNLITSEDRPELLQPLAEKVVTAIPAVTSFINGINPGKAQIAVSEKEHILVGEDHITESLDGLRFRISAGSFFQTNTKQAANLYSLVIFRRKYEKDKMGSKAIAGVPVDPDK